MSSEINAELPFELIKKIGEGYVWFWHSYCTSGFGSVWKARDRSSSEIMAVKMIPVKEDNSDLIKEINILKGCHCDFVIQYYDNFSKNDCLWVFKDASIYYT